MDQQHYKLVRGQPAEVEAEVNELIQQGWMPYGELLLYTPANSSHQIVIQQMAYLGQDTVEQMME